MTGYILCVSQQTRTNHVDNNYSECGYIIVLAKLINEPTDRAI